MKFIYCPHCGDKLIQKEIGDEGMMPYCNQCEIPVFDVFQTCVIVLVVNEYQEIALLRQDYVSQTTLVCVAGHIKSGETAEYTATREVEEEIGLHTEQLAYMKSYYYEKRDMMMLGFIASVLKAELHLSKEVDHAEWFTLEVALTKVKEGSIAMQLIEDYRESLHNS